MNVEATAWTCRINKNNNIYQLSGTSQCPAGKQKLKRAVTQYQAHNTCNMTEASQCIYTYIH